MIVLLIAAIGTLVSGVLAIFYGISYKEFSFGNTMILAGVIGCCTGFVLFGLWIATREMRGVARRMTAPASTHLRDPGLSEQGASPAGPPFGSRPAAREPQVLVAPPPIPIETQPSSFPPFPQAEIEDRRSPDDPMPIPVAGPEPQPKPRRNLLFESSARKDRERAASTGGMAPAIETGQRAGLEDPIAQRGADRTDRLQRTRSPSTFPDAMTDAIPQVTVLKSGVVDGMAYSLYSDGSIEAQMPEGMMRFGSIEELRAHLDQRT